MVTDVADMIYCHFSGKEKKTDGKLNFQEYLAGLFRLIRNYDEFSLTTPERGGSSEIPAKKLFTQLDLNNDGYVTRS